MSNTASSIHLKSSPVLLLQKQTKQKQNLDKLGKLNICYKQIEVIQGKNSTKKS